MRTLPILLAALALAAPAAAAPGQESWFQDDNKLEFSEPGDVARTMDRLRAMGVDRLRVSVFWLVVAPQAGSREKPKGFDGSDPDAYPQANWERYDTIARLAAERGLGVMWDVTGPSPAWGTRPIRSRPDIADAWYPDAREFGAFVRAVGTRYSGSFIRPADRPKTVTKPAKGIEGTPFYEPEQTTTTEPGPPLPRVDHWEIWNEPNQGAWLAPQHRRVKGTWVPTSPRLYRRLADQTYAALAATGHGDDLILLGATAPKGSTDKGISRPMSPELFIRELYCVDRHNQAYRGAAARRRGCPAKNGTSVLPKRHPVLFRGTFSHHPYELTFAPGRRPVGRGDYTLRTLGKLSHTLRYAYLRYGRPVPRGGVALYLSEYGYQTDPPDRRSGVSLGRQARYLAQAEYLAWRLGAVQSFTQYLLYDNGDPVDRTFQTGLLFADGRAKPSYRGYRVPIWLPDRRGRSIRVWGMARPAANGAAADVAIQYRRRGAKGWRTLATRQTSAARNYLYERVTIPGRGQVRLRWGKLSSLPVGVRG